MDRKFLAYLNNRRRENLQTIVKAAQAELDSLPKDEPKATLEVDCLQLQMMVQAANGAVSTQLTIVNAANAALTTAETIRDALVSEYMAHCDV